MGYQILTGIYEEIDDELHKARAKFDPFNSAHEGYAVLLEEVDELWHEIKHGTKERQRSEAVQIAAMAIRLLQDCCKEPTDAE